MLLDGSSPGRLLHLPRLAAPLLSAFLCAACAQNGAELPALHLGESPASSHVETASLPPVTRPPSGPDIQAKPEVAALIREARALRTAGKKAEALTLLDKAPRADKDPILIGERGLIALELGQTDTAERLLAKALNPKAPDWRMLSAYGAALSANGKQSEAQAQFAKALTNAPDQPSILNNLALSFALEGRHQEAERILRQAAASTAAEPQAKQNLALILGLTGKVDEARQISEQALPPDSAKANVAFFEQISSGRPMQSRAEQPVEATAFRSASASRSDADRPIMQLGVPD